MYNQTNKSFSFDKQKGIETLLYITYHVSDLYKSLKILYFADKLHLSRYGRFISGDRYIAMKNGPVPSESYDILKAAKREGVMKYYTSEFSSDFEVIDNCIKPKREPNVSFLSESDIECLNQSIEENKQLSFGALKDKSHDFAYENTENENDEIPLELIAQSLDNKDEVLEHLKTLYN